MQQNEPDLHAEVAIRRPRYSRYEQAKMLAVKFRNLMPAIHVHKKGGARTSHLDVRLIPSDRDLIVEALQYWALHNWTADTTGRGKVNDAAE